MIVWAADSFALRLSTGMSDSVPLSVRLVFLTLLFLAAMYLAGSGHKVVSRQKRPVILVTSGAFRYVRHPLYLGSILFYLGLTVSTGSLFSLGLLGGIFLFYDYIADYEEKRLSERFGEEYVHYMKHTGKWVPRLSKSGCTSSEIGS